MKSFEFLAPKYPRNSGKLGEPAEAVLYQGIIDFLAETLLIEIMKGEHA